MPATSCSPRSTCSTARSCQNHRPGSRCTRKAIAPETHIASHPATMANPATAWTVHSEVVHGSDMTRGTASAKPSSAFDFHLTFTETAIEWGGPPANVPESLSGRTEGEDDHAGTVGTLELSAPVADAHHVGRRPGGVHLLPEGRGRGLLERLLAPRHRVTARLRPAPATVPAGLRRHGGHRVQGDQRCEGPGRREPHGRLLRPGSAP